MKLMKKALSFLLAAAMLLGVMCAGTVNAAAASNNLTIRGYESGKYYCIAVEGISSTDYSAVNKMYQDGKKSPGGNVYFPMVAFRLYGNGIFEFLALDNMGIIVQYDNALDIDGFKCGYQAMSNGNYAFVFQIPKDSKYVKEIVKCDNAYNIAFGMGTLANEFIGANGRNLRYYSDSPEWTGSAVEDSKKETAKDTQTVGKMPKANGKQSARKYTVTGNYTNSDKSDYRVEIDGILKEEYEYLMDCHKYFNKKGNYHISLSDYSSDFSLSYYGGSYESVYAQFKNIDFEDAKDYITAKFVKSGSGYKFVFDIRLKNKVLKEAITKQIKASKTGAVSVNIYYYDNNSSDIYSYYGKGYSNGSLRSRYSFDSTVKKVTKKKVSSLKVEVPAAVYKGKAVKPSLEVKDGSYTLVKGTDYTVTYSNNNSVGTATATIKGKGSYTGTKTVSFKIKPSKPTLKSTKVSNTKLDLSWSAVKGATKYQVYCSTNGGKYVMIGEIDGSMTTTPVTRLDFEKNDYKFKVRAFAAVNGENYYGSYSKAITVK